MGWKEDLERLIGESENTPFNELAEGNWGGAATAPISAAFNLMDLPLSTVKEGVGQGINVIQGEGLGEWGTGRKEWEGSIEEVPMPIKIALELGLDPTTYIGAGLGRKAAVGLRGAAELREAGLGANALRGTARGLEAADFVWDKAPNAVVSPILRPIGKGARAAITRISPQALELSKGSSVLRGLSDIRSAYDEKLTSKGKRFRGMLPAPVRGGTKSLATIDDYDVPPFFDGDFDDGVPSRVKQLGWESWQALRMSRPDIPGITAPGISSPQPGQAVFAAGQRPGDFRDVASRYLNRVTDPSVGFIPPPPGGYRDPYEAMANIDEDNLQHMANIMAAVMVDFDNDTANKMFQPLRRANEGMQLANESVMNIYGPGIQPALPSAMDNDVLAAMQREAGQDVTPFPDARFATPYGFPEERTPTTRLDRLEGKPNAYETIAGKGFAKGSPELVETAAGMGGGFMAGTAPDITPAEFMGRYDAFEGSMRPTTIDPATGRAAIPDEFTSQWELNRDAYAHFVSSLFPGMERRPQEMEVLRQMSIETLYDNYVNAATEVSGGKGGATTFLKKGRPVVEMREVTKKGGEKVLRRRTQYHGDEFQKIGAYADPDDPSQIGNRLDRNQDLDPGMYGKPSWRAMNVDEYKNLESKRLGVPKEQIPDPTNQDYSRITGTTLGGDLNNTHLEEMIETMGGTPWRPNRKGGLLPNISKLIEEYHAGKDILVGDIPASEWYDGAVKEALAIVGPGRYEDATMLLELMAITSSGTEVTLNAKRTLKAFAEWKLGSDDMIRNGLGLSQEEADMLLKKGGTWEGIKGTSAFRKGMSKSQKTTLDKTFEEYVARRGQQVPSTSPIQGGPKTHNFSGSFLINLWQDALDYSLKDKNPALYKRINDALDKAAVPFAWDRHMARGANQATAVTPMEAISGRELGIQAAKVADVRPEDFQAGLWYTIKDRQGFLRVNRSDDMARAMREGWNNQLDPDRAGDARFEVMEMFPEIADEPDLVSYRVDEMMRQEAAFSIIEKELSSVSKTMKKELGTTSGLKALFGLGDDTLGIINRAGRGITPTRRASLGIPRLVSEAEQELRNIRSGQSIGSTFGWNGSEFVRESPPHGFAVALTSAGRAVNTKKPITAARGINQFLIKYADLLDDPAMAERIKFGTFVMDDPGEASFDLSVIVPDESTAIRLARESNQKAIYDIAGDRIIDTGGDGTPVFNNPNDIRRIIEDIFGKQKSQKTSIQEALTRGVTIHEMDKFNPVSILNRRVVTPFMEKYEEASKAYVQSRSGTPGTPQGVGIPQPDSTAPFDFEAIGQDPLISTQANTLLNQSFDDTGRTYGSVLDDYYAEGESDLAALDAAGVMWGPDTTLRERIQIAEAAGGAELASIVRKYDKSGIDPRYSTPRDIANLRLSRDVMKKEGIEFDKSTTWDLVRAAWGEQALFSPKYHFGNIQGAWIQNAFGGHFAVGTPREYLSAFKISRGGLDEVSRKDYLQDLKSYQVFTKWGFEELPSWVSRGGVRSMTSNKTRSSRSAMGELAGKITRNETIGRTVGKPFVANADFSQGIETVIRGTLAADVLDREMTAAMAVIEDSINTMASRQGLEDFEFSVLNNINPVPGGPSPKRLKEHLIGLGFAEGYAERAGRNFAEAKNVAEGLAKKEVEKRQFSYDRTNLDEFVGKFIPFHYWYSRALRYYGEEALRHPYLILNYMRANQGIENAQDDPGLSARQKGFLRLMGTPLGFSVLMNPDALFGVVKVFGLQDTYDPEGQTEAGGVIQWLKNRGLGLYPWIDGTLNLMGVFGDTYEPDLLGIRHKAIIGAAVQFARSQLGFDPAAAPYATAMGNARWNVSSFVSQFTPDWLAQPVLPKAGGGDATLDTIIESRIVANNPSLSNEQLLDIMANPESPEFIEAYQQTATAGLAQQLLNFAIPQQFRVRDDARDVRAAQVSTIYEAAEKQGTNPWEFKPSAGDVEFATRYKQLTGKDWQPGDYTSTLDKKNLTEATPESKPFILAEQEYNRLGGEKNQRIFQRYNDLRNGVQPSTATLSPDVRHAMADRWAETNGYTDNINYVYQLREAFETSHPEFQQFKTWQGAMFDLKNQFGGNLDEYRRQASEQNPNAARYFERIGEFVRTNYPRDEWVSEFDRRTTNSEAYQTINGIPTERFDPAPIPGVPQGDPTAVGMTNLASQSYNPGEDWVGQLQRVRTYSPQSFGNY